MTRLFGMSENSSALAFLSQTGPSVHLQPAGEDFDLGVLRDERVELRVFAVDATDGHGLGLSERGSDEQGRDCEANKQTEHGG